MCRFWGLIFEGLMRILTKRIIQPGGTDGESGVVSGVNSTSPLPSKEKPPSGKCSDWQLLTLPLLERDILHSIRCACTLFGLGNRVDPIN